MARWFTVIERDPLLRTLLAAPVPIPRAALQRVVAEIYKRLAFHRPARGRPARGGHLRLPFRRPRHHRRGCWAPAGGCCPSCATACSPERIDCPVLMVWGERDVMVFPTGAGRVLDAVRESRLVTLSSDCGHSPQIEMPDRLADLVLDFPASLAAP